MAETATRELLLQMAERAIPRRVRSMREFAEAEIIIPDGPFENRRYRCDRQPYSALFFDAVQDPYWSRFVAVGPSQTGKSLTCYIIPTLYHLFEIGETVICGLPSMDMAADKWNKDFLPVIEKSRYRDFLPKKGPGSRGGRSNLTAITFTNGATLRFMTAGGNDKKRAGYTARVLVITETDGMDESGGTSKEADKIKQLEARLKAWKKRGMDRTYMECTVTVEDGKTWKEYTGGSQSRLAIRCPHCNKFVTPEREHLVGWNEAEDILEAGEKGHFTCPECGSVWSEQDREVANRSAVLVHKGQTVGDDGVVHGPRPRTDTLGFRWSSTNNMLADTKSYAQAEWKASREGNEDNAEKEMCQFIWAKPYKPTTLDLTVMDHNAILARVEKSLPRGHLPHNTQVLTVGCDVGKWLLHWVAIAFRPFATPHIVDYGRVEVPSSEMAVERAIVIALRKFRDEVLAEGWETPDGNSAGKRKVEVGYIDSRYFPESVNQFCDETKSVLYPTMGYGSTQRNPQKFIRKARDQCVAIGEEYQVVRRPGGILVEVNADHWKGWLHKRLQTPLFQPGSATLFNPGENKYQHLSFAKHLVAEKKEEVYVAGTGTVTRWKMLNRANHFLDATAIACAAGHAAGVRPLGSETIILPSAPAAAAAPSPAPPRNEDHSWMPERPSGWMPER